MNSSTPTNRANPPGFTLIELLVVIAIVAILAGLILPVLARARMATDGAVCRSNERQIGLGLQLYLDEGGVYPGVFPASATSSDIVPWYRLLEPFVKDSWPTTNGAPTQAQHPSVFACPGYKRINGRYSGLGLGLNGGGGAYGYNYSETFAGIPNHQSRGLSGFNTDFSGYGRPLKETQVAVPSDMIAVTDSVIIAIDATYTRFAPGYLYVSHDALSVPLFVGGSDPKAMEAGRGLYPHRHDGRFSTLFCDGHVNGYKTDDLFDPHRDDIRSRWHFDHQP